MKYVRFYKRFKTVEKRFETASLGVEITGCWCVYLVSHYFRLRPAFSNDKLADNLVLCKIYGVLRQNNQCKSINNFGATFSMPSRERFRFIAKKYLAPPLSRFIQLQDTTSRGRQQECRYCGTSLRFEIVRLYFKITTTSSACRWHLDLPPIRNVRNFGSIKSTSNYFIHFN